MSFTYRPNDIQDSIQKSLIVSVVMSYNGFQDEVESLNNFELRENLFTGYNKVMVRAINKIREKSPIVNDVILENFLVEHNFLNEKEFISMLSTNEIPLSAMEFYINKLEEKYTERLLCI